MDFVAAAGVKSKGKVKSVSAQGNPTKVATTSDCEGSGESGSSYSVTNGTNYVCSIGQMVEGLFFRDANNFQITSDSCS